MILKAFSSCSEGIERYENPCVARSTMGCRRREQVVEGAAFLVWLSLGGSCREEEARNHDPNLRRSFAMFHKSSMQEY